MSETEATKNLEGGAPPKPAVDEGAAATTALKTVNLKTLDPANLYRVDIFTDPNIGDIRMLVPVDVEGLRRDVPARFLSTVGVTVNGHPNTINFEIEGATTLAQAIEGMPAAAEVAGRAFLKQLEASRTKRALIVPPGLQGLPS